MATHDYAKCLPKKPFNKATTCRCEARRSCQRSGSRSLTGVVVLFRGHMVKSCMSISIGFLRGDRHAVGKHRTSNSQLHVKRLPKKSFKMAATCPWVARGSCQRPGSRSLHGVVVLALEHDQKMTKIHRFLHLWHESLHWVPAGRTCNRQTYDITTCLDHQNLDTRRKKSTQIAYKRQ